MTKNDINITTDFLCDFWMAVCKEANSENTEGQYCESLIHLVASIEKVLVLKLQNEMPSAAKVLAIITDFGQSRPMHSIAPLLKAYKPDLNNVQSIKDVA